MHSDREENGRAQPKDHGDQEGSAYEGVPPIASDTNPREDPFHPEAPNDSSFPPDAFLSLLLLSMRRTTCLRASSGKQLQCQATWGHFIQRVSESMGIFEWRNQIVSLASRGEFDKHRAMRITRRIRGVKHAQQGGSRGSIFSIFQRKRALHLTNCTAWDVRGTAWQTFPPPSKPVPSPHMVATLFRA